MIWQIFFVSCYRPSRSEAGQDGRVDAVFSDIGGQRRYADFPLSAWKQRRTGVERLGAAPRRKCTDSYLAWPDDCGHAILRKRSPSALQIHAELAYCLKWSLQRL